MRRIPSTVGALDLRTATAIGLNGRRFFFTTTDDLDANGIPDHQELAPDSPVDLNQAGTPDVDQIPDLFKALRAVVGEGQVGLATGAETAIRQVASLGPDQFESHGEKPDRFHGGS